MDAEYRISCGPFPGGDPSLLLAIPRRPWPPRIGWLDEDRIALASIEDGGAGITVFDLRDGSGQRLQLASGGSDRLFFHGVLDPQRVLAHEAGNRDDGIVVIDLAGDAFHPVRVTAAGADASDIYALAAEGPRVWFNVLHADHRRRLYEGRIP